LLNLEPGVEDIRRIGAEAVIPAVLTRAVAIDFVLLKPWSLPIQKILIAFQWRLYKLASWLTH
jgi:hypothetical protein